MFTSPLFGSFLSILITTSHGYLIKYEVLLQLAPSTIFTQTKEFRVIFSYYLLSFDLTCFYHLHLHIQKKLFLTYKNKWQITLFAELYLPLPWSISSWVPHWENCNAMFIYVHMFSWQVVSLIFYIPMPDTEYSLNICIEWTNETNYLLNSILYLIILCTIQIKLAWILVS